ncbi:DUF4303 domain-containing protein [Pumilibacter muris]|uniref:DUF4303 domain-containing protein n=1 Tax=Pumilibacter muris TaxID=2941510 RepID=UPI002041DEB1|nr:DUF4303 domain-containing protein [Pumilibacter muris]
MTDEQIAKQLLNKYKKDDAGSSLTPEVVAQFNALFREAVIDFFPKFVEKHKGQTIYGISFEIGNLVQFVYEEDFETYLYFNTEEEYRKQIKDCAEDEKLYYRFEPYAEWDVVPAGTKAFKKLQKFLMQNSLYYCTVYYHYDHLLSKEVVDWFEENSEDFEENFDSERAMFRTLMAGVLCNLRQEGFWKEQGLEKLYVIPFEAEDELPFEEKIATYL